MKRFFGWMVLLSIPLVLACESEQEAGKKTVQVRFPICFQKPKPEDKNWADCGYDRKTKEWFVNFWDCENGTAQNCTQKKFTAWYRFRVDKKDEIQECSGDMSKPDQVYSCKPFSIKSYREKQKAAAAPSPQDDRLYCANSGDCFWFQCCQASMMGKPYFEKHWKELFAGSPEQHSCEAKCEHDSPPQDVKLECVAHQCMALDQKAPAIDPDKAVVWIGKSEVVGQCEHDFRLQYSNGPTIKGAPVIIKEAASPGINAGPEFTKHIAEWQKETFERNRGSFQCEACHVCKDFAMRYLLIYLDDLDKFTTGSEGWMRVDK